VKVREGLLTLERRRRQQEQRQRPERETDKGNSGRKQDMDKGNREFRNCLPTSSKLTLNFPRGEEKCTGELFRGFTS